MEVHPEDEAYVETGEDPYNSEPPPMRSDPPPVPVNPYVSIFLFWLSNPWVILLLAFLFYRYIFSRYQFYNSSLWPKNFEPFFPLNYSYVTKKTVDEYSSHYC
jgi:hypothetical protein